jgi:hypothetical protein
MGGWDSAWATTELNKRTNDAFTGLVADESLLGK